MNVVKAASKLAESINFDKIGVNAICEEAGICRATFYYHFKDKYDIVQWHFDTVSASLRDIGRTLTWAQGYRRNTFEVLKFESLYISSFNVRGYQSLFSHAKRRRREHIKETIVDYKMLPFDEELEFQTFALAEAEVGSMNNWFREGMPYDMDRLCTMLEDIIPRRLHDLLDTPVNPQP